MSLNCLDTEKNGSIIQLDLLSSQSVDGKKEENLNEENDKLFLNKFDHNEILIDGDSNIDSKMFTKTNERLPDPDSLKMFVGQIPRDWNEAECRKLLSPFGEIYSVNILRDKITKQSNGCCFVTFFTRKAALEAQNALHNLKKLPSCRNPIQMRPADNENKNDRKIFIGKLPNKINEDDLLKKFSTYGYIEECIVLRDANGQSRGCAFVTYSTRTSATNAIKAMNQSKEFEECAIPLVVKFAESNESKRGPKPLNHHHQMTSNGHRMFITNHPHCIASAVPSKPTPSSAIQPTISLTSLFVDPVDLTGTMPSSSLSSSSSAAASCSAKNVGSSMYATAPTNDSSLFDCTYLDFLKFSQQHHQQQQQQLNPFPFHQNSQFSLPSSSNPVAHQQPALAMFATAGSTAALPVTTSNNNRKAFSLIGSNFLDSSSLPSAAANAVATAYGADPVLAIALNNNGFQQRFYPTTLASSISALAAHNANPYNIMIQNTHNNAKQTEGPEGANLFIYHLPAEYTDFDLIAMFRPFGQILSAKVFIDKNSNLSKCFGFVSYDNKESAQNAIRSMNGFQVLNKRLKVQLKKAREKPY